MDSVTASAAKRVKAGTGPPAWIEAETLRMIRKAWPKHRPSEKSRTIGRFCLATAALINAVLALHFGGSSGFAWFVGLTLFWVPPFLFHARSVNSSDMSDSLRRLRAGLYADSWALVNAAVRLRSNSNAVLFLTYAWLFIALPSWAITFLIAFNSGTVSLVVMILFELMLLVSWLQLVDHAHARRVAGARQWLEGLRCIACEYSLVGNPSGRCPECGLEWPKVVSERVPARAQAKV